MRRWLTCVIGLCVLIPNLARGDDSPVIALHAEAATTKLASLCGDWAPKDVPCSDFAVSARVGQPCNVYLVAARSSFGIGGVSCGIAYDGAARSGVDVFGWTPCTDGLEFSNGSWPASGGGNRITWLTCQTDAAGSGGIQAVVGSFYVYAYSPDNFTVTPNMNLETAPELVLWDCTAQTEVPLSGDVRGSVRFTAAGDTPGYNPCSGQGDPPPPPIPPGPPTPPPPPPPPTAERDAAVSLHILPESGRSIGCDSAPALAGEIVTSAVVPPEGSLYTVYLLGTPAYHDGQVAGLWGLRVGLEAEIPGGSAGLEILGWQGCGISGMIPVDGWPVPGSGATMIWEACQTGDIAVAGYFTVEVHGPGALALTGYPYVNGEHQIGPLQIQPCGGNAMNLEPLPAGRAGWVSFGGAAIGADTDGCNPLLEDCAGAPVAVKPSSWGKLKARY